MGDISVHDEIVELDFLHDFPSKILYRSGIHA